MLKLQEFIKEHSNFKELLPEKPYSIKIIEDEHFMLFKYSQIDSDFNNELVRECRGIILDKSDWSIACHPFHKFGNYGESYVPDLDWDTVSVQEKRDGCVGENELVMTSKGHIPIKEICNNPSNFQVLTYDFSKNRQELVPIEEVSIKENNNDWYKIELENGTTLTLTGKHKVWIKNLLCYRAVENLQKGDEVQLQ